MKKSMFLLAVVALVSTTVFGQSWQYEKDGFPYVEAESYDYATRNVTQSQTADLADMYHSYVITADTYATGYGAWANSHAFAYDSRKLVASVDAYTSNGYNNKVDTHTGDLDYVNMYANTRVSSWTALARAHAWVKW